MSFKLREVNLLVSAHFQFIYVEPHNYLCLSEVGLVELGLSLHVASEAIYSLA